MSDGITDCARQCENYLELCRKYNEFPKIKIVNGVEYIDFFSDHYYNLLALDRSTTGK